VKGSIVLLADAPEGQICHYLFGRFGKDYGGRLYRGRGGGPAGAMDAVKLIFCTRYPDHNMRIRFSSLKSFTMTRQWEQTLALLEKEYPQEASVAVIPDGTMQYFRG